MESLVLCANATIIAAVVVVNSNVFVVVAAVGDYHFMVCKQKI